MIFSHADLDTILKAAIETDIEHVLQYFKYDHLPSHLQLVSKHFADLAQRIAEQARNRETTVALRKLLEAKDAAVRAVLIEPAQARPKNIDAKTIQVRHSELKRASDQSRYRSGP